MCAVLFLPAIYHALPDPPSESSPELLYRGGQNPIVHLEVDLRQAVVMGGESAVYGGHSPYRMPVPTYYFEDRCDLLPRNWARLTGTQCRLGTGGSTRKASRRIPDQTTVVPLGPGLAHRRAVAARLLVRPAQPFELLRISHVSKSETIGIIRDDGGAT